MNDKIIQIIPCASDLWSRHVGEGGGEKYDSLFRVVCFALIEDSDDGYRYVRPMIIYADGMTDYPEENGDFKEIVGSWKEAESNE